MLVSFFLKRFLQQSILCFILITLFLAASNVFVRLPGIMSIQVIPTLFLVMLPLVSLFALPLACPLAIQAVIGNLLVHEELLFLMFVKRARSALYKAILLFTLITMSIYVPLVFFWAPSSYNRGKQLLIGYAYEQLRHLESRVFHTFIDGISVYFNKKIVKNNCTQFGDIFLVITSKNHERYFFTAQQGELLQERLMLKQGSLIFIKNNQCYSAQFAQVIIDAGQLWHLEQDFRVQDAKFKLLPQLIQDYSKSRASYIELHKRLAQLLWQLLIPFIAVFLMIMTLRQRKATLLRSIIVSGLLFFAQYITLTLAQATQHSSLSALILFYLPPLVIFLYCLRKAYSI